MIKKNIIVVSDFEFDKSGEPTTGYSNIACEYGKRLQEHFNLIGMGISYRRNVHNMPFDITQVPIGMLGNAIASIHFGTNKEISQILVLLDIHMQNNMNKMMRKNIPDAKQHGVFAVEGEPINFNWARELINLNSRWCISDFGVATLKEKGVKSEHAVVPIDLNKWPKRTNEDKEKYKKALGLENKTVFLINADSNERKNLSTQLKAFAKVKETNPNVVLILLTRLNSPVGWDYGDLVNRWKITNDVILIDRGLAQTDILKFYFAADFLLNCSKAEGLGMSVIEAQAVGVPVIATNCTGMTENISDGKGIPVEPFYVHTDVFGNCDRYYVHEDNLAKIILENIDTDHSLLIEKAYNNILERNKRFEISLQLMKEKLDE